MALLLKILGIFFLLFNSTYVFGQYKINGVVKDSLTNEPLAFTTIIFNDSKNLGISTDINGRFFIETDEEIQNLYLSHIGYKSKQILFKSIKKKQNLELLLEPYSESLPETIITLKNPGLKLIKKVIERKDTNNPKKLNSFLYTSYSKTVVDYNNKDSLKKNENYTFLTELVSKRMFLKPDLDNEEILASKMSGIKQSDLYFLAYENLPFSFYEEPLVLLNQNYLNPLSVSALKTYKYKLEDTYFQKNDTIFIISFRPKAYKHINSLKGILYISSDNYAVQNVIAEPYEAGKIHLKIQQQYKKTNNHWFPEQLNYQATFTPILNKKSDTLKTTWLIDNKTFIENVSINPPLKRTDFKYENLFLNEVTNKKASILIAENRAESLTQKEIKTYQTIDSIADVFNFENKLNLITKLPFGKIALKNIDIDLKHLIKINRFEKFRLGFGLSTNEKFDNNISFSGYYGYGFKDKLSKYGVKCDYVLNHTNDLIISASWDNTLIETGNYGIPFNSESPFFDFNPRNFMSAQFDKNKAVNVSIGARSFRYLNWDLGINYTSITPLYGMFTDTFNPYVFQYQNNNLSNFSAFQLQFNLRFAYKEKIINMFDHNLSKGTDYPVFNLFYERAIKDIMNSDVSYNKIELDIQQQIILKKYGEINYNLSTGIIDSPAPYGLLFGGHGSFDKKIPLIAKNHFQTMLPYEFVSDKYINLFLTYKMVRFLPKNNLFSPDISLAHNMGIGGLSRKEVHQNIIFNTIEKPYLESGLLLSNLINFDLYNISNFGVGGAIFYRYGVHGLEKTQDNFAFKIEFAININ